MKLDKSLQFLWKSVTSVFIMLGFIWVKISESNISKVWIWWENDPFSKNVNIINSR